ncbi:hypothetical protein [uncultured Paraglaciecola sp.]|uniref:hypothetical protein n=1 Tax=uncultured Paraglaciecola sp. TaxID=1765024 RepID=UPI00260D64FB|nr:hypothetical protein [uncultured Paraglaciecola sp.]
MTDTFKNENVEYDMTKLNKLISSVAEGGSVKIGVLGSDAQRGDGGIKNSELAAIHELGSYSRNIPPRSFLRAAFLHGQDEFGTFLKSEKSKELIAEGDTKTLLARLGLFAETLVQRAFETSGFGQWPALQSSTVKAKGSSAPLIDTGQLRRSISSEVE